MEDMPKKKKFTKEQEEAIVKDVLRVRKELSAQMRKKDAELILIAHTYPRIGAPINDCLDFLSRFELKPFNLVRVFPKKVSFPFEPKEQYDSVFALRLYTRNLEVPLTYDDYQECLNYADTYWVLLRFMIIDDDYEEMLKYKAKILSGDYDFVDENIICACEPFYKYLDLLPDDRNIPAFFKYLTDPNCSEKDEKKALELYDQLFPISFLL